jgi:hypothetical protein
LTIFGNITICTIYNDTLAFGATHRFRIHRFTCIAIVSACATIRNICGDVCAHTTTRLLAIGTSCFTLLALLAIADVLRLRVIHHAIHKDFELDAAIGAIALGTIKRRRSHGGIGSALSTLTILTVLAILSVCAITDVLRLHVIDNTIDQNLDFNTAIRAITLHPRKLGCAHGRGRTVTIISTARIYS